MINWDVIKERSNKVLSSAYMLIAPPTSPLSSCDAFWNQCEWLSLGYKCQCSVNETYEGCVSVCQKATQERAAAGRGRGGPDSCGHAQETSHKAEQHQRAESWDHWEYTQRLTKHVACVVFHKKCYSVFLPCLQISHWFDFLLQATTRLIFSNIMHPRLVETVFLYWACRCFLQVFKKCCRTTHLWAASTPSGLWSNIIPSCTCWTAPASGQQHSKHTLLSPAV